MSKKGELKEVDFTNQEVTEYDFIICPNCGEEEVGKYCPNCGQSNKDFNKPLKQIVGDLLDSINLDIRLVNTLVPFFAKPGFLAQEYFNGRRKRYVPPMRMYMFFSLVFFFLVAYVGKEDIKKDDTVKDNVTEEQVAIAEAGIATADSLIFLSLTENEASDSVENNKMFTLKDFTKENKEQIKQEIMADSMPDGMNKIFDGAFNASEKKELFIDKFYKYVSYALFLLMPLFAFILAAILWRSRLLFVNHLIFSINFHSFIFGLASVGIILYKVLPESFYGTLGYLYLGIPLYLMVGIKRFYNRKYIGAFFKTIGALTIYSIILSIAVVAVLAITAQEFANI